MEFAYENLGEILRQHGLVRTDDSFNSYEHERKPREVKRVWSSLRIAFTEAVPGEGGEFEMENISNDKPSLEGAGVVASGQSSETIKGGFDEITSDDILSTIFD